jgi:hypothetical protein
MKKRLMTGLLAGGLMVGMLPGIAGAAGNGPPDLNSGRCVKLGFVDRAADPANGRGPTTWLDGTAKVVGAIGHGPFIQTLAC